MTSFKIKTKTKKAKLKTALNSNKLARLPRPVLVAHRGASIMAPENTLTAFKLAVELGADAIELDVRLSKDQHVVVIHDSTVNHTTDGFGPVSGFTLAQLQKLNAGFNFQPRFALPAQNNTNIQALLDTNTYPYRQNGLTEHIPSLEEVFKAFPDVYILVEIKEESIKLCRLVAALIKRYQRADRTLVMVFRLKQQLAQKLRHFAPEIVTGHTTAETDRFTKLMQRSATRFFHRQGISFETPLQRDNLNIVTPNFIAAAHNRGIKVLAWTINDPAKMAELFQEGVDGIITDWIPLALIERKKFLEARLSPTI